MHQRRCATVLQVARENTIRGPLHAKKNIQIVQPFRPSDFFTNTVLGVCIQPYFKTGDNSAYPLQANKNNGRFCSANKRSAAPEN